VTVGWLRKLEGQWKDLPGSEQEGTALLQPASLLVEHSHTHTHTHTHTLLSKRSKKIPPGEAHILLLLQALTWCDPHPSSSVLHLSAEPSSASHTPPRSGSSSPTSSLRSSSALQTAEATTHQELIQPRLPRCHRQPPVQPAPARWARRGWRRRTSQQRGSGGSCVSTWTCTSRLFAGTFLGTARLLLPGKFSQRNYAPSLFFRHSRSDWEANVNQTGEHWKERARRPPRLPQQAPTLLSPAATPAPLACAFFSGEVCLRGVQASLQRNNTEMPFMISTTYGNRMCTLGVFICSPAQVPKQAALLSSPSYSSSRGINLTKTLFYFSHFPANR